VTVTIDADDPRTIRAIEIAAAADQWLLGRNAEGDDLYGVPSQTQAGRYYSVTQSSCDCADFRRHAESEPRPCKHILAVRLYRELVRAAARGTLVVQQPRTAHTAAARSIDGDRMLPARP
jgi:hypothetical protein